MDVAIVFLIIKKTFSISPLSVMLAEGFFVNSWLTKNFLKQTRVNIEHY